MSEVVPVSRERHAARAWKKGDFSFARGEQVTVISLREAPQLMMSMPLCFLKQGEQMQFIALLGLRPGENVWVGGDGRWLAPRAPAVLQQYPFRLMRNAEGKDLLGVDETGLLSPGAQGTPFFVDGKPHPDITATLEQLVQEDRDRQQTHQLSAQLDGQGLLDPWPLQLQDEGRVRNVDGLYRVNEKKLNELPAEEFLTLRGSGGLLMAYVQLLSMQHTQQLARMAEALATARLRTKAGTDLMANHGIISFSNL